MCSSSTRSRLSFSPGSVWLHGQRADARRPHHHCDLQRRCPTWNEKANFWRRAPYIQVPREEGRHDPGLLGEISWKAGPKHARCTQADPPTVTRSQTFALDSCLVRSFAAKCPGSYALHLKHFQQHTLQCGSSGRLRLRADMLPDEFNLTFRAPNRFFLLNIYSVGWPA